MPSSLSPRLLLAALITTIGAGCYTPTIGNGDLQCSPDGRCPQGFYCAMPQNTCWRDGTGPGGVDLGQGRDGMGNAMGVLGDTCIDGTDCASGHCADGVCCDTACTDSCRACNLAGSRGTCSIVPSGTIPLTGHDSCMGQPQSTCGRDGTCDDSGNCRLWNDVECKPASCDSGLNEGHAASKCDGQGNCVDAPAVTCAPFKCKADNTGCATSCTMTNECVSPNSCVNMSCGKKPNGAMCSAASECSSNNCVDGFCCNSACGGTCEACDVSGSQGTCTAVTSGQPHGTRGACTGSGVCQGSCTASNRMACTFPTVSCRTASCTSNVATLPASCSMGSCPAAQTQPCSPYTCNATATGCNGNCANDSGCQTGQYCDTTLGQCKPKQANGAGCTLPNQCSSNICVDNVCCGSACNGTCQRCASGTGTCTTLTSGTDDTCSGTKACTAGGACKTVNGSSCTINSDCLSGFCVGSVCCNSSCTGACQTCTATPGSCTNLAAGTVVDACGNYLCSGGPDCYTSCTASTQCKSPAFCDTTNSACVTSCFPAGTLVDTASGMRPIESIAPGDLVASYDVRTGESSFERVEKIEERRSAAFVAIGFDAGDELVVTPEHSFWVESSGWVRARELEPGDAIRGADGKPRAVRALQTTRVNDDGSEATVYNLVVAGPDTYFVGRTPVLVHSCDFLGFSSLREDEVPR